MERPTYREELERLSKETGGEASLADFLARERLNKKTKDDEFFSRAWCLKEVLTELRHLAKDLELAKTWSEVARTFVREVALDSADDLQRKADFLLRKLRTLNYGEFVLTMTEAGMQELTRKLQIAITLSQDFDAIDSTTVDTKARKLADLEKKRGELIKEFPESEVQINALIDCEKSKLTEGK